MNPKHITAISGLLSAAALISSCAAGGPGAASPPNTLTAVKVDAISMDAAASVWSNAPKTEVATKGLEKGEADGPKVTVQAVHDGKTIAFRAEWTDATENVLRRAWTFDGKAFKRSEEQDRFSLIFPVGNNAEFASKSCAAACHNSDPDKAKWEMAVDNKAQTLDLWHWQAGQSGVVGQADDLSIGVQPFITTTGRLADKSTKGGSVNNQNKENNAPIYMSKNGPTAKFILAGDEVPIDLGKLTPGARIPAFVVSPWDGSRSDVSAKGTWANGKWTLVLSRALDTGNDDDVKFIPTKATPFGLAVWDNAQDEDHKTVPDTLTLAWR